MNGDPRLVKKNGEIRAAAHAKLNLFLEVPRKRDDGFHDIESLFQEIALSDELTFRRKDAPGITFSCSSAELANDDNLAVRAAEIFIRTCEIETGVDIALQKNIPAGAGLGGGSSDAAMTIVALNALFGQNAAPEILAEMAAAIGSDVPFFIRGGTSVVRGRGEIVTRVDFNLNCRIVLVLPKIHVATRDAYAELRLPNTPRRLLLNDDFALFNRFEETVFERHPRLREIKNALAALTAPERVAMSGSGSCIFALIEEDEDAGTVAREIAARTGEKTVVTATFP